MAEWMAAGEMLQIEALALTHPKERNRDFQLIHTQKKCCELCLLIE